MPLLCDKCGSPRHNVKDKDNPTCWRCRRAARKDEEGYRPQKGRGSSDPNMARTCGSNVWTKMPAHVVAWLKINGPKRRASGVWYKDIRDELAERFDVEITVAHVQNILAGRAWAWMTNPEEYLDD